MCFPFFVVFVLVFLFSFRVLLCVAPRRVSTLSDRCRVGVFCCVVSFVRRFRPSCFFSPFACCCVWRPDACSHFQVVLCVAPQLSFSCLFSGEGRGFDSKSVTDTRATTDKNDPFLNMGFKHGKKWVDKNGAKCNTGLGRIIQNTRVPWCGFSGLHGAVFSVRRRKQEERNTSRPKVEQARRRFKAEPCSFMSQQKGGGQPRPLGSIGLYRAIGLKSCIRSNRGISPQTRILQWTRIRNARFCLSPKNRRGETAVGDGDAVLPKGKPWSFMSQQEGGGPTGHSEG